MDVTEAECLLGLTGQKYDNQRIQLAYIRASRDASTRNAKKRCREARDTLERYYRSLCLTHQVDGSYSAEAMSGGMRDVHEMTSGVRSKLPHPGVSRDVPSVPSSDPSKARHKVRKALLMTLWEMTPWRFYLVFWSVVIGVLCLFVASAFPVTTLVTDVVSNVCQVAFVVGLVDAFWLHKGAKIGGYLAGKIDAIE